jgi:hypothetical protein
MDMNSMMHQNQIKNMPNFPNICKIASGDRRSAADGISRQAVKFLDLTPDSPDINGREIDLDVNIPSTGDIPRPAWALTQAPLVRGCNLSPLRSV